MKQSLKLTGLAVLLGVAANQIDFESYAALYLLASIIYVTLSHSTGAYYSNSNSNDITAIRKTVSIWIVVIAFLSFSAFLLKNSAFFSRGTLLVFAFTGAGSLLANRLFFSKIAESVSRRDYFSTTNVVLVESVESGREKIVQKSSLEELKNERLMLSNSGFNIRQRIELPIDDDEQKTIVLQELKNLFAAKEIEAIFLKINGSSLGRLDELSKLFCRLPVPVHVVLDPVTQSLLSNPIKQFGGWLTAEIQRAPLSTFEKILKRVLDVIIAASAILLLLPLILMTAILIKLDSNGPVFFIQDRRGFSGKIFKIVKFRSMTVVENGRNIKQATANDSRVTRVGRFIRRASVDELPQLWNVLRGDMSIVGPRPHAVAHDDYYGQLISEYADRHHVKPGITGLAQVRGLRGETAKLEDMEKRVKADIAYINSWSIGLDLLIIVETAWVCIKKKNAY